jgi:hypothetical protein
MTPNIFISSTISDLHHLRDAVRDTVLDLHYLPRMSEYGDLGYLPAISAIDSCYQSIRECQLFILIIGKKYGYLDKNSYSVTHNEFRTAKELNIPIICLIDQEVNTFKQIYEANPKKKTKYPGMDQPEMSFKLIQEFSSYPENNGYLTYKTISDARNNFKNQLAHIFCDLLLKRFDPIRSEIKDILAEISTLRHTLLKDEEENVRTFTRVTRLLLDEQYKLIKSICEKVFGGIEFATPSIIKYATFKAFVAETNINYKVSNEIEKVNIFKKDREKFPKEYTEYQMMGLPLKTAKQRAGWDDEKIVEVELEENKPEVGCFAFGKNHLWTNVNGDRTLQALFGKLKKDLKNSS